MAKKSQNDSLRILQVSTQVFEVPPRLYGGLERVVADLSEELIKLGHQVSIACPKGSEVEGAEIIECGDPSHGNPEGEAYQVYRERLESGEFSICHDHSWAAFPYLSKMDHPELKILHTVHAMQPFGSPPPVKFPCFVGISDHHCSLISSGLGVATRRVYNGIDLDRYEFNGKKRDDYLLFVGRMQREKGPHEFIDLCRRTRHRGIVIGEDRYIPDPAFVPQIMDKCDGRLVQYWGPIPNGSPRMVETMQKAKAVVMPLLPDYFEAFGLWITEANACGTPVITLDRGSPRELVKEGINGFVRQYPNEMDECVKMLDDIDPAACRKEAEKFSRKTMAKNYVKLYRRLMAGEEW
jgi:glycosyltransferase involved in cell wall biosynthesis